jgi:hypothetical protein
MLIIAANDTNINVIGELTQTFPQGKERGLIVQFIYAFLENLRQPHPLQKIYCVYYVCEFADM